MFGYIKQVDLEVAEKSFRAVADASHAEATQVSGTAAASEVGAGFWRWWISLYRPESRPTTASL